MMQHEFSELTGEHSVEVFELMQAVYGDDTATPQGGQAGHEAVARYFKRNRAAVLAMAAVLKATKVEAADAHRQRADAVEAGKAQLRAADRRNDTLQREAAAQQDVIDDLRCGVGHLTDNVELATEMLTRAQADLAAARGKLYTLAAAARIMDDLKAEVRA